MKVIVLTSLVLAAAAASTVALAGQSMPQDAGAGSDAGGGDTFVRSYSKEELRQTLPANPVVGLGQRLNEEFVGLINQIGANLQGREQRQKLDAVTSLNPTEDAWAFQIAALAEPPTTRAADIDGARSLLAGEAQRAATSVAKVRFDIVNRIGSGCKFNLDMQSLFGGDDGQEAAVKGVRYGLIVEDIVPDMTAPKRAALGDGSVDELEYAGQADVKWSIGPLADESRSAVTPVSSATAAAASESGILTGIRLPSPRFAGTITPENLDNLANVKDKDNMPLWNLSLKQEQEYYSLSYRTTIAGKRVGVEHALKVPVAGTLAVGRRYSESLAVVETSVYNVLYDARLPALSVHQMHLEQRYKAAMSKSFGAHSVGIEGRGKAGNPDGLAEGEVAEAYSLGYSRSI